MRFLETTGERRLSERRAQAVKQFLMDRFNLSLDSLVC